VSRRSYKLTISTLRGARARGPSCRSYSSRAFFRAVSDCSALTSQIPARSCYFMIVPFGNVRPDAAAAGAH
jgi:hypothetical protein